jgi:cobalt-zinc-cadmium efflux system membrane fusion protein
MTSPFKRQAGRISQPQLIAFAVILALGLAGGAFVLRSSGGEGAATEGAREAHEHAEAKGHDDKEHHEGKPADAHEDAKAHGDAEHHDKTEGHDGEESPVALTAEQIKSAGIVVEQAAPGLIKTSVQMPGEVRFNEDRTAHVVPRVAGVVESVSANLGQQVKKGQVLAVISSITLSDLRSELLSAQKRLILAKTSYEREKKLFEDKISPQMDYLQAQQVLREAEIAQANAGQKLKALGASPATGDLNRYELRAPFDGMVVEKHLALGEAVKEDANVFTLSDLSTVWAEISVPAKDLALVRVGEQVVVRSSAFEGAATGTVAYVSALIGEQTRTATARVVLANPKLAWRPGLFVNVAITSGETNAPVTVAASAIQAFEGREVVFVEVPGGFKAPTIKPGRTDGQRTEIISGLKAGERYASTNSFVIKAEIGKASAAHED